MIDEPFPAEHPYSSHTPRFAVFPKFDSPDDLTRGVDARTPLPKHPEMPSQPYDVTIISKTKGNHHCSIHGCNKPLVVSLFIRIL